MIDLIPQAMAASAAAPAGQPSLLGALFPFVLLALFMWFFLFRPQRKQRQEHRKMLGALQVGDEVITSSGIVGIIREFGNNWVMVEVDTDVRLRIQRHAILSVLPKGTIETDPGAGGSEGDGK